MADRSLKQREEQADDRNMKRKGRNSKEKGRRGREETTRTGSGHMSCCFARSSYLAPLLLSYPTLPL
jgi:hypothetical protein